MQKKQKTQKKVAMPDSQPPLTRDRILDAAQTILLRDGGDRLTIASVAKEARISKGGLFYHFASKQELVEGLIERYTREFDLLLESAGDSPGSAIDAYIRSAGRSDGPASRGVIAMLAAVLGAERGAAAAAASTTDGAEPTPLQSAVVPDDALFAEADALARTGGDGTLLASLLNTFVIHCRSGAGLPQQIDALTEARAVQQQAHALRGTAANVGATAVAAAAGALERAARAAEADPAGMKAALLACHSAIEAFVPVADQWLATRPLMPVPPLGVPLTPDGMASLKRKLRARQLDALDDVARIIELYRRQGRYALETMCIGGGQGIAAVFERA